MAIINELYERHGESIRVGSILGEGQFGVVWSGTFDDRMVAVKQCKKNFSHFDLDTFIKGLFECAYVSE